MLLKLAWRNIWRSRLRSLVVISAIAIGVWALLFLLSFSQGLVTSYIADAIDLQTSHLQIHHPNFKDDYEMKYKIDGQHEILEYLESNNQILGFSSRVLNTGMVASSKASRGINIIGIDPKMEKEVSSLYSLLVEGDYLPEGKKNTALISAKLASKLGVKLRSKVVLTFQDVNQEMITGAFRIAGIFESHNAQYDELNIFVNQKDLIRLTGFQEKESHEIAMLLKDFEQLEAVTSELKEKFPATLVEPYNVISPDLELFNKQMALSLYIMTVIFMLALIFGIINTMLMAVLERMRELGMLMAIGMNKTKVFLMIVLETVLLGLIGGPIGIGLAWLTIKLVSRNGIDLSAWSDGMQQFGMSTKIFPSLKPGSYIFVGSAIVVTAVLASIYPARKATKLKPVDALRTL